MAFMEDAATVNNAQFVELEFKSCLEEEITVENLVLVEVDLRMADKAVNPTVCLFYQGINKPVSQMMPSGEILRLKPIKDQRRYMYKKHEFFAIGEGPDMDENLNTDQSAIKCTLTEAQKNTADYGYVDDSQSSPASEHAVAFLLFKTNTQAESELVRNTFSLFSSKNKQKSTRMEGVRTVNFAGKYISALFPDLLDVVVIAKSNTVLRGVNLIKRLLSTHRELIQVLRLPTGGIPKGKSISLCPKGFQLSPATPSASNDCDRFHLRSFVVSDVLVSDGLEDEYCYTDLTAKDFDSPNEPHPLNTVTEADETEEVTQSDATDAVTEDRGSIEESEKQSEADNDDTPAETTQDSNIERNKQANTPGNDADERAQTWTITPFFAVGMQSEDDFGLDVVDVAQPVDIIDDMISRKRKADEEVFLYDSKKLMQEFTEKMVPQVTEAVRKASERACQNDKAAFMDTLKSVLTHAHVKGESSDQAIESFIVTRETDLENFERPLPSTAEMSILRTLTFTEEQISNNAVRRGLHIVQRGHDLLVSCLYCEAEQKTKFGKGGALYKDAPKRTRVIQNDITRHFNNNKQGTDHKNSLDKYYKDLKERVKESVANIVIEDSDPLAATRRAFVVVYTAVKINVALAHVEDLLGMADYLGAKVGHKQRSHAKVTEMVSTIAKTMENVMVSKLKNNLFFSLLLDASTDHSGRQFLLIYVRFVDENDIAATNKLLACLEMDEAETGKNVLQKLIQWFEDHNLKQQLNDNLISMATDGASNMMGGGVGLKGEMKAYLNRELIHMHCLSHKLELALSDGLAGKVVGIDQKEKQYQWREMSTKVLNAIRTYFGPTATSRLRSLKATQELANEPYITLKGIISVRWASSEAGAIRSFLRMYKSIYISLVQHIPLPGSTPLQSGKRAMAMVYVLSDIRFYVYLHFELAMLELVGQYSRKFQSGVGSVFRFADVEDELPNKLTALEKKPWEHPTLKNMLEKLRCREALSKNWHDGITPKCREIIFNGGTQLTQYDVQFKDYPDAFRVPGDSRFDQYLTDAKNYVKELKKKEG